MNIRQYICLGFGLLVDHLRFVGVHSVLAPLSDLAGRMEGLQGAQLCADIGLGKMMYGNVGRNRQPLGTGAAVVRLASVWREHYLGVGYSTGIWFHNTLGSARRSRY